MLTSLPESRLFGRMRFGSIAVAAALTCSAAFAQDSGVLVPTPPRKAQEALGSKLRINQGVPAPAKNTKVFHGLTPQPPACAIRLVEAPIKEDIDNGVFLKGGKPVHDAMIVQPAVPECPKGN